MKYVSVVKIPEPLINQSLINEALKKNRRDVSSNAIAIGKLEAKDQTYIAPLNEYRKLDRNNDKFILLECICAYTNRSQAPGVHVV